MWIARKIFWLILILLVNGWVDYANASLKYVQSNIYTHDYLLQDDFDTLYEWVAESLFDVEDAIPEQEGDADDNGKISPAKILLASGSSIIHEFSLKTLSGIFLPAKNLLIPPNIPISIWDPPPNA